jgi:predicted phosphodiesterase
VTRVRFIGDTHGNTDLLEQALLDFDAGNIECIYHVGDIGMGFNDKGLEPIFSYIWHEKIPFIAVRGNHDNPNHWVFDHESEGSTSSYKMYAGIKSGFYPDHVMTFVINGALSIDQHRRIESVDWWPNEEHTINEFNSLVDSFETNKPRFVISHDGPQSILENHFFPSEKGKMMYASRTRQALDAMLTLHKPELWVFGHWHEYRDKVINGTRFICVAKDKYIDLDV